MENTITTTQLGTAAWIPAAPVMTSPYAGLSSLECTPADVRGRTTKGHLGLDEQTVVDATVATDAIDFTPGSHAWSPPT